MSFMVVREVDKEVLSGNELHDRISQELHSLIVAPRKEAKMYGKQRLPNDMVPVMWEDRVLHIWFFNYTLAEYERHYALNKSTEALVITGISWVPSGSNWA